MFDKLYLRRLLNLPTFYMLFGKLIAPKNGKELFVTQCIGSTQGLRILDLGCGPASILHHIHGETLYVGIDNNSRYIETAKRNFVGRETCEFYNLDLNDYAQTATQRFDLVIMTGVLHHIDDNEVEACMTNIKRLLTPNGRFVSRDPCYTTPMNPIARALCSLDRGRFVRTVNQYVAIQQKYWANVKYDVRTDTLRFFPYSVISFCNTDKSAK